MEPAAGGRDDRRDIQESALRVRAAMEPAAGGRDDAVFRAVLRIRGGGRNGARRWWAG